MKKRKSHVWPRMKSHDERHKNKKGKPRILSCLSPVPDKPCALKMQEDLMSNKIDAAHCFFVPPTGM